MNQAVKSLIVPWVLAIVKVSSLIGRRWCNVGEEVPLPLERAKKLRDAGIVDYSKHAIVSDEPIPTDLPPKSIRKRQRESSTSRQEESDELESDTDGQLGGNDDRDDAGSGESYEDLGIVGKTAELLIAGGISTPSELREKVAVGFRIDTINGIGKATAASVLAALNPQN